MTLERLFGIAIALAILASVALSVAAIAGAIWVVKEVVS